MLKKEDGVIDWTMSATAIANRIRGLTPWPGAYTFAGEERWIIWRAAAMAEQTKEMAGTVTQVTKDAIHVATGDGVLMFRELQPANRRRMTVSQYLAAHPISVGTILGRSSHP
jgi:methionyl-tRNA formyltransferase